MLPFAGRVRLKNWESNEEKKQNEVIGQGGHAEMPFLAHLQA